MSFKKILLGLCFYGFFSSCERPGCSRNEVVVLQNLLVEKTTEIQQLKDAIKHDTNHYDGKLMHTVYFNLRSSLKENELNQFTAAIESLREIDGVEKLLFGNYLEVGDTRSMKEMELVMQLVFKDMDGLKSYQNDSIHLKVKKSISPFLENAPVTYDYIVFN